MNRNSLLGLKISVCLCHPPMWFKYYICGHRGNGDGVVIDGGHKEAPFALKNGRRNPGVCQALPGACIERCSTSNVASPPQDGQQVGHRLPGTCHPAALQSKEGLAWCEAAIPTEEAPEGPGPTVSGWRPLTDRPVPSLPPPSTEQSPLPATPAVPIWSLTA